MKLKFVLYLFFILKSTSLFSQAGYKVLYDRLGLHLYYRYDYYNAVKINEDLYDQYKITGYAEYEGNKPIFTPINFRFSFQSLTNDIVARYYTPKTKRSEPNFIPYDELIKKIPNSRSSIDFNFIQKGQQRHKFWGIGSLTVGEKIDTTTVPYSVNNILLPGYKSECVIYILVEKGKLLPTPEWQVSDLRHQLVFVEPYWEKNNVVEELSTFDNSSAATPIGGINDTPALNNVNSSFSKNYGLNVYKSIEDLKILILENLRQNTTDVKATFSDEYAIETIKYGNQKFKFSEDNFEFEFQMVQTKKLKSINYYERITPKKVLTKIPIYDLSDVLGYFENKQFPKKLIFSNKEGSSTNGRYIFTNCYNKDYVIEAGEMLEPQSFYYGYNFGNNDENFIVLKNLIAELHKQVKLASSNN